MDIGPIKAQPGLFKDFEHSALYHNVYKYVQAYMSRYDCSHDFEHVRRVLAHAKNILAEEIESGTANQYDSNLVVLAALLHDVGDHKYKFENEEPDKLIAHILTTNGCTEETITKVKLIVENVSYSNEVKDPHKVRAVIATLPELAIVQDADRLDSIGAVGIGRVFAYGAVKAADRGLQGSIQHFTEKLERVESMMKTATGMRLAQERTQRLRQFRSWWEEEAIC